MEGTDRGQVIRTLTAGSDLIIVNERSVTSLDRRTGEQNWYSHLEQFDGTAQLGEVWVLCGASSTASEDGKLAVTAGFDEAPVGTGDHTSYGPTCGLVMLVDLATGEFSQSVQVAYEEAGSAFPGIESGMPIEIVGDTLVVTWYATIFGLALSDLSEQWRWIVGSNRGRENFECTATDMALGEADHLVVTSRCISEVGEVTNFVDELSAAGEVGRGHEITAAEGQVAEISSIYLIAASPVVLWIFPDLVEGVPEDGVDSLVTLDDSWEVLSVIHDERTTESSSELLNANSVGYVFTRTGAWREPSRSTVVDGTLVSFTPPNQGQNRLLAIDLATGEERWSTDAEPGYAFFQVLPVDEETVVAVASEDEGPHHAVLTADLATGEALDEASTAVEQPSDLQIPAQMAYLYADHRAYGVDFERAGEVDQTWMAFTVG